MEYQTKVKRSKRAFSTLKQRSIYCSFILVKRVVLIRLKEIMGNHEINWIVSMQ